MSWSFNASGFTGDIEKVKELISGITAILRKPEYGTGSSMVSSPLGLVSNFHTAPDQGVVEAETGGTPDQAGDPNVAGQGAEVTP